MQVEGHGVVRDAVVETGGQGMIIHENPLEDMLVLCHKRYNDDLQNRRKR